MHLRWRCGWNLTEWAILENTVTRSALTNQQNVVQNEKRESVDNAAYGFNNYLILKTLYPKDILTAGVVIGDMTILQMPLLKM